MIDFKFILKN